MLCVPTVRPAVAKVATPLPFSVPLPRTVEPSLKSTLPPEGAREPEVTVAVKVTDPPTVEGLGDGEIAGVVGPRFTIWLTGEEVLLVKLLASVKTATMLCVPTDKLEVVNVAEPLETEP